MKIVFVVAVVLVDRDGRILLSQRPSNKSMSGLWEFPGGKVESGELPEEALIRELKEELGIETWGSCLAPLSFSSHSYDDFHLLMPVFVCRRWVGEPKPMEGQVLKWVNKNNLKEHSMPAADIPIISVIRDLL